MPSASGWRDAGSPIFLQTGKQDPAYHLAFKLGRQGKSCGSDWAGWKAAME
jgi:hypothetical protein